MAERLLRCESNSPDRPGPDGGDQLLSGRLASPLVAVFRQ